MRRVLGLFVLGLILWTAPASAQITLVHHETDSTSNAFSGFAHAFTNTPTANNALFAIVITQDDTTPTFSGSTNVPTMDAMATTSGNYPYVRMTIWSAFHVTGTATTWTFTNGGYPMQVHYYEYSGIASTSGFDQSNSGQDITGTNAAPSSGNVTTTVANELLLGGMVSSQAAAVTFTAGSSFTNREGPIDTAWRMYSSDRIVSSTGTYAYTGTLSGNDTWIALVATYKDSSSDPPPATGGNSILLLGVGN